MQKKKDKLLGKIVKKNYNNKLEEVLEQKGFSEYTKSLLLSMLYKIEVAYSDYEKVKHNTETKEEYIENIISTIRNDCELIEIINQKSPQSKELGRRTFIIDKIRKTIKSFPIERKVLYAIAKIGKKDLIIDKERYGIFAKPVSDLINIGNNINTVEPLRDFNGYSWTALSREIESIEYNLVYQNLRILLDYQFLNAWVRNREYMADYMALFKKRLQNRYGAANAKRIEELVFRLAILLQIKYNAGGKGELDKFKYETMEQISQIDDKGKFAMLVSQRKKEINESIRSLDQILNNEALLQREFERRNNNLPDERKFFSINSLADQLIRERELQFQKIEKLNKLLIPQNFVKYKQELENKEKYLRLLEVNDINKEIYKQLLKLQKVFLECFAIKINEAQTKSQITQVIYELRYYYLLTFDINNSIYQISELKELIDKNITILLTKTKKEGITGIFTENKDLENQIFREILSLRTIGIDDIYMKITKEKEVIYLELYDEESLEQKVALGSTNNITRKDLDIKLNKKIKFFY